MAHQWPLVDPRRVRVGAGLVAIASLSVLPIESAWAYLDPATGWMIVQGFVAALAAAGVAVGTYWSRIKEIFSRRKGKQGKVNAAAPPSDPSSR